MFCTPKQYFETSCDPVKREARKALTEKMFKSGMLKLSVREVVEPVSSDSTVVDCGSCSKMADQCTWDACRGAWFSPAVETLHILSSDNGESK